MEEKNVIAQAIKDLEGEDPKVEISSIRNSLDWVVKVNGKSICTITEIEKDSLMGPLQDYAKSDTETQKQMITDMWADTKEFLKRRLSCLEKKVE